jgi:alpha-tubulin suppressor-like RCC1 family protein
VVAVAVASGSGTLAGTTTATSDASGVATFANLTIVGEGANTLRFTSTALADAVSNTIVVGARPARTNLLSTGFQRSCVRSPSTGVVSCWGTSGTTPAPLPGGLVFAEFSTAGFRECGRLSDGVVLCQGENQFGTLGVGIQSGIVATLTPVVGGHRFVQVKTGNYHACGRKSDGSVYCWGLNAAGQLGDGSTTERVVPTLVSGGRAFIDISVRSDFMCGRDLGGAVACWGSNWNGQMGDGTTSQLRSAPSAVAGSHAFAEVAVGGGHACGRRVDGVVLCWGRNDFGQVGDGTMTDRLVPTPIAGGRSFVELSLGTFSSCGRQADGTTYCWGQNAFGQFGNGSTNGVGVSTPTLAAGGRVFAEISLAGIHACGLERDGTVYCWGGNDGGELGDGTRVQRLTPVRIGRFP